MPELSDLFKGTYRDVRTVPPFPEQRDTSRYRLQGERVPSVTECVELAGVSDFAGIPRDVLENAADRGKWGHHFCDKIDRGHVFSNDDVPEEVQPRLDAYRKFLAESRIDFEEIELVVRSQTFRFAGTLDRIGLLPGIGRVLIDIKLPIKPAPSWKLQTAGYTIAYTETTGNEIHTRYSLQLSKEGNYSLTPAAEDYGDRHDFLAAVRVAHFKIRNGIAKLED